MILISQKTLLQKDEISYSKLLVGFFFNLGDVGKESSSSSFEGCKGGRELSHLSFESRMLKELENVRRIETQISFVK